MEGADTLGAPGDVSCSAIETSIIEAAASSFFTGKADLMGGNPSKKRLPQGEEATLWGAAGNGGLSERFWEKKAG